MFVIRLNIKVMVCISSICVRSELDPHFHPFIVISDVDLLSRTLVLVLLFADYSSRYSQLKDAYIYSSAIFQPSVRHRRYG